MSGAKAQVTTTTTRKGSTTKATTRPKRRKVAGMDDAGAPRLLLTVEEAAYRLHISKRQMERLILRGVDLDGCASLKIGGLRRVPLWALEEYIRRQAGRDSLSA